jgi:hypothetical protein
MAHRLLVSALLCALLLALVAAPAAALTPNHSIFFFKKGTAHTGVLKDGVYTRKRVMSMGGVTHAAVSRDSLALYNRGTGRLRTGTFRGGVYTPVTSRLIQPGFTHLAASCDSLILYNALTGSYRIGAFTTGRLRGNQTGSLPTGVVWMTASCDSLAFVTTDGDWWLRVRTMSGGGLGPAGGLTDLGGWCNGPLATSTADSLLMVGQARPQPGVPTRDCGRVGRLQGGVFSKTSDPRGFSDWSLLAGTARNVLFYHSSGLAYAWRLSNGSITDYGQRQLPRGWKVIAGGK